ncbi:hypothetical protein, partial [Ralstonia pseudosolanacearum]|uniref:hypothetical protein n=1 Tax=Ralstonia pseudosolanacearum TaxID=1310165 RepID=UPI003C7A2165
GRFAVPPKSPFDVESCVSAMFAPPCDTQNRWGVPVYVADQPNEEPVSLKKPRVGYGPPWTVQGPPVQSLLTHTVSAAAPMDFVRQAATSADHRRLRFGLIIILLRSFIFIALCDSGNFLKSLLKQTSRKRGWS